MIRDSRRGLINHVEIRVKPIVPTPNEKGTSHPAETHGLKLELAN